MGLFESLRISASGLSAQRMRMDIVANNVANLNTTRGVDGQPYRRQSVTFREQTGGSAFSDVLGLARGGGADTPAGVEVAGVHADTSAPRKVHNPSHPDADENGDIFLPNIDMVTEMTDLVGANRAYQASVTVLNATKAIAQSAISIGRNG
ncbi:MAG: flagellar basal body rod protein FlgC [Dehalococcoidia bacterium]